MRSVLCMIQINNHACTDAVAATCSMISWRTSVNTEENKAMKVNRFIVRQWVKSNQIQSNRTYNLRHTKEIKHAKQLSAEHYIDNNYTTNKQNIVTSHNIHKTNGTQQGRTNSPCKHMPPPTNYPLFSCTTAV